MSAAACSFLASSSESGSRLIWSPSISPLLLPVRDEGGVLFVLLLLLVLLMLAFVLTGVRLLLLIRVGSFIMLWSWSPAIPANFTALTLMFRRGGKVVEMLGSVGRTDSGDEETGMAEAPAGEAAVGIVGGKVNLNIEEDKVLLPPGLLLAVSLPPILGSGVILFPTGSDSSAAFLPVAKLFVYSATEGNGVADAAVNKGPE